MPDTQRGSSNTKPLEFGTEKGLLSAMQGDGWLTLLKSQTPQNFQQSPLCRKGKGGAWLVVASCLVLYPVFLRSGQWSGNDVSVNLHQANVTHHSDKKGKVPRHKFHPLRSRSWLKKQIQTAAPSGPGPQACPAMPWLREAGTQGPAVLGLFRTPKCRGQAPSDCVLWTLL